MRTVKRKEFYKRLWEQKLIFEYIKVIVFNKFRFKRAIKKSKSFIVSYPEFRCLGKSTLIDMLSVKYKLKVLTRYRVNRDCISFIKINPTNMYNLKFIRGARFLIDNIDLDVVDYLKSKGAVLIGYIE